MEATEVIMPTGIFNFAGQAKVDTFAIDLDSLLSEQRAYDKVMINKYRLSLEAIRYHANEFAYWQRRKGTGRPPVQERDLLIAFLVRQLFDATFRETEGLQVLLAEYFDLEYVPDHTVLCRKNASRRWLALWKRFFSFVLESLPRRSVVVTTDASGFSGRKRSWRETDHEVKASENWVKVHAAIEVDELLVLSYSLTGSNVHDSQTFASVWDGIPDNVMTKRSLADSAYHGERCLAAARQHGAVPLHGIKKNARHFTRPETFYQKMVSFWQH